MACGMNGHLTKPINIKVVMEMLQSIMKHPEKEG